MLKLSLFDNNMATPTPVLLSLRRRDNGLRLLWELPGGVQAIEFDYNTSAAEAYQFYKTYLGYRIVVSDQFCNRPVAEGFIYGIAITPTGNRILCRGPWFRHYDQYDGTSIDVTLTTTEIVQNTLTNFVPIVSSDQSNIDDTGFQLDPTPGTGPNVLSNGGFETAGTGGNTFASWTNSAGDGTITDETALVQEGSHAVKLTAGASVNTCIVQTLSVVEGEEMQLPTYTRGDGTYAGRYKIYDVTNSADIVALKSTGVTGTSYTQVTETFTVPTDCTDVEIYLYCPSTDGGIAYFDTCSLATTTVYWRLSESGIYPGDVIKKCCAMSDSSYTQWNYWVKSAHFDGTTPQKPIPYFKAQIDDGTFDWQICKRDLGSGGFTAERNIEELANKVLVIYTDLVNNEQALTTWATDSDSQSKFWTREVLVTGGEMISTGAEQYRDLYINKYKDALLSQSFTITAPRIMDSNGNLWPLWTVIKNGGGYLRLNDLLPEPTLFEESWDRARIGQIMTAEYDASANSLRIVLDTEDTRLDYLIAQMAAYS